MHMFVICTGIYMITYYFLVYIPDNLVPVIILIGIISYSSRWVMMIVLMVHSYGTLLIYEANLQFQELN